MTQEKPWWEDKEFYQIDNLGDAIELDIEAIIAEATRRGRLEMAEEIEKEISDKVCYSVEYSIGVITVAALLKIITHLKNDEK